MLLPYTLGTLLAVFTLVYRLVVWLQRPATALYWRRGWELSLGRDRSGGGLARLGWLIARDLLAQTFLHGRGRTRWLAHVCLAWGCAVASAVVFPLVFGWLHFETRADDPRWYQAVVFGIRVYDFHLDSWIRHVAFNLLNLSSVLVIVGAGLALRRRHRDRGSRARQQFGEDIAPLLLLLAVAVSGLLLTFSAHVLHGAGSRVISVVHAVLVVVTLLSVPFGKLLHVFQRPLQLGVALYRHHDRTFSPATCRVCGSGFAGACHVRDLKAILAAIDLDWGLARGQHYGDVCPRCRRRLLGHAQGRLMGRAGNSPAGRPPDGGPTAHVER